MLVCLDILQKMQEYNNVALASLLFFGLFSIELLQSDDWDALDYRINFVSMSMLISYKSFYLFSKKKKNVTCLLQTVMIA